MAVRKRRGRKHPGVVLVPPEKARPQVAWRARYKDPDSGRTAKISLPHAITTAEQRQAWAVKKSRELERRLVEIEGGADRATGTALADAVQKYFDGHPQLREKTVRGYRDAADKLLAWARKVGVRSADDLTRAKLVDFRAELLKETKAVPVVKGKRGGQQKTISPRSPHTINRDFRSVNTVLRYLRDLSLLPKASHEDLKRAFKRLPAPIERIEFLSPEGCKGLIEAALRHDAAMFKMTGEEHDGHRPVGTTARYGSIAPFVVFVLLTGMRLSEAVELEWSQVDLNALGNDGNKVGEIQLYGSESKTHRARTVYLEVSPALRSMLVTMRLASGGQGRVFGLTTGTAEAAAKRLRSEYGAPKAFGWQALRRTCGTYLTNAPGIFGGSSAYQSAKQLGHSVQVAEKHYLGVVRGIPRDARTLDAAMQIEDVLRIVAGQATSARAAHG